MGISRLPKIRFKFRAVDQEGNVYAPEVGSGRLEKFRPRQVADPALLVAKSVHVVWK